MTVATRLIFFASIVALAGCAISDAPSSPAPALQRYASEVAGGLTVEVQSLSLRMRCHRSGLSDLQSYCAADASLQMAVSGRDRGGDIRVSATKDATERAQQGLLCISTMPAVTAAVDKALAEALVDLQGGLGGRTGIPAR
jgi:hypothetical protein